MKRNTALIKRWPNSISLFILCLLFSSIHAQEQITVHASGISVSRDKTPKEALNEALIDAKKNALLKAGIFENLVVSNLLYTYGNEQNVETFFHGISNSELTANILIDSIHSESNRFDEYGNMIISVEIEAVVYAYDQTRDPGFFFDLNGLKEVYYENEHIAFSFVPSQNGYLTIFAFNESESFVLYPFDNKEYEYLSDEKERVFIKEVMVSFPINEAYDPGYAIEMNKPLTDEASLLLFIYTKNHIPWIDQQISLESVRSWIYEIPINEREVVYRNVLLKQLD
ncbi:hypothetical protein QWY87_06000 [Lutimonas halocynthiae]|uniref:hypothetical protein n=1 Tax=Lutimonas halocynthiae TaxID=1446477 RepID=UPI0025B31BDF|nr:hypothetical protein [Lutimonas halocynthiae]MDN3642243.1 hypothetical protein [Lutimonas halocynthiae]